MNYDDIINLPRPISLKHRPMPVSDRAAQFGAFAALTGHGDAVEETARKTQRKINPHEDEKAELNQKLVFLHDNLQDMPYVTITHFVEDTKKSGGKYMETDGTIKSFDLYRRKITFTTGEAICIDNILKIEIQ